MQGSLLLQEHSVQLQAAEGQSVPQRGALPAEGRGRDLLRQGQVLSGGDEADAVPLGREGRGHAAAEMHRCGGVGGSDGELTASPAAGGCSVLGNHPSHPSLGFSAPDL